MQHLRCNAAYEPNISSSKKQTTAQWRLELPGEFHRKLALPNIRKSAPSNTRGSGNQHGVTPRHIRSRSSARQVQKITHPELSRAAAPTTQKIQIRLQWPGSAPRRHICRPLPPHLQASTKTRCFTCHQLRVNHHRHQYASRRPRRM